MRGPPFKGSNKGSIFFWESGSLGTPRFSESSLTVPELIWVSLFWGFPPIGMEPDVQSTLLLTPSPSFATMPPLRPSVCAALVLPSWQSWQGEGNLAHFPRFKSCSPHPTPPHPTPPHPTPPHPTPTQPNPTQPNPTQPTHSPTKLMFLLSNSQQAAPWHDQCLPVSQKRQRG